MVSSIRISTHRPNEDPLLVHHNTGEMNVLLLRHQLPIRQPTPHTSFPKGSFILDDSRFDRGRDLVGPWPREVWAGFGSRSERVCSVCGIGGISLGEFDTG